MVQTNIYPVYRTCVYLNVQAFALNVSYLLAFTANVTEKILGVDYPATVIGRVITEHLSRDVAQPSCSEHSRRSLGCEYGKHILTALRIHIITRVIGELFQVLMTGYKKRTN